MSYLFIAEKPAMGRDIAKARASMLGVSQEVGTGFIKVGPDIVTWVIGHLYELQPPEHYDPKWKFWRIEDLPIIPAKFERRAAEEDYQVKQLRIIRELLKKADTVVNVGDAGREGQLLIDELLQEMKWDPFGPKTMRLWISSLAEKDVIAGMNRMFPNKDKLALFEAAFQRQMADWIHGLSLTRFYTAKARLAGSSATLSIGRVQTPTLKLVVDRDRAIENFKRVKHYRPSGFFRHANGTFKADWEIPADSEGMDPEGKYLIDKKVADAVAAKIMGKEGRVTDCTTQKKRKSPPMPYTLDSLTKACTSKYQMTADEVAAVMQKLYEEHKIVSYPRTDCEYLPVTILKEDAPAILTALAGNVSTDKAAQKADLKLRSAAWNDAKITDHYGIIPTANFTPAKYAVLSQAEKNVFDLIAQRFIVQFYPDQEWNSTAVTIAIEGYKFRTTGRVPLAAGWTSVYNTSEEGDEPDPDQETDQALPEMKKGDSVVVDRTVINDSTTSPPSAFNDGTLIEAMKFVYKFVTNPEIKKRLKDGGLGTSATRGPIIKNLLQKGYLKRKGKTGLISTEQGRAIIDAVPDSISSPELTAIWEQQLDRIQRGEADPQQFHQAIRKSVTELIERVKNVDIKIKGQTIEPLPGHGNACPSCGKGTLVTRQVTMKKDGAKKRVLSCSAYNKDDPNSCRYVDWGDGPKVEVPPLPEHGKTCPKCGKGKMLTRMVGQGEHKGLRFLSCDQWSKDDPKSCSHSEGLPERPKPTETMEGDGTTCPKCKKGTLRTRQGKSGKLFLACDNWRAGDKKSCDHVVWGEDKIEPLEGHGAKCDKCGTGLMMTKQAKGGRFLSCNTYPKCDNAVFPDSYNSPKKSGGGNVSFGNRGKSPVSGAKVAVPTRLMLPPKRK